MALGCASAWWTEMILQILAAVFMFGAAYAVAQASDCYEEHIGQFEGK